MGEGKVEELGEIFGEVSQIEDYLSMIESRLESLESGISYILYPSESREEKGKEPAKARTSLGQQLESANSRLRRINTSLDDYVERIAL